MIPQNKIYGKKISCTTRTSGGDPKNNELKVQEEKYYPHERGWSRMYLKSQIDKIVLPARAGVILRNVEFKAWDSGTTRTSGGDPLSTSIINIKYMYYPHERGWSCRVLKNKVASMVLPARAGVILQANEIQKNFKVLPVLFRLLLKIYF